MNSQVVKCWNCGREFEVILEREPLEWGLKVLRSSDAVNSSPDDKSKDVEIARICPFCGKTNMIVIKEG